MIQKREVPFDSIAISLCVPRVCNVIISKHKTEASHLLAATGTNRTIRMTRLIVGVSTVQKRIKTFDITNMAVHDEILRGPSSVLSSIKLVSQQN